MPVDHRITLFLAFLVSCLVLAPGAKAQPTDLFAPADAADARAAPGAAISAAAARQRLVRLNPAADTALAGRTGSPTLRIELFPDTIATFRQEDLEAAFGGGNIWSGGRTDDGDGAATLVIDGKKITGQVDLDGRIFRIDPLGGGLHRVTEVRPDRLPPPGPIVRPPAAQERGERSAAPHAAKPTAKTTTIDVLFAYTSRAKSASSNIKADIDLAVSLANQAYKASDVQIHLRLAGTIFVKSYDEAGTSYYATLNDLSGLSGSGSTSAGRKAFQKTRKMRDSKGADLVVLIREGGEYCGLGWLNENMSEYSADYGYSEVSRECLSTYTAAHEMGHNMGLNHDRYVEPAAPKSKYNYGFVNVGDHIQDIMAYDNRCAAAGVTCRGLNKFSNPRKQVKGDPFGIPKGTPGAADASRWLNEVREDVANFRPSKSGDAVAGAAEDARAAAAE